MAVELVQGFTGSVDGLETLACEGPKLLPALFKLVSDNEDISKAAITSLVNLSQVPLLFSQAENK